MGERARNATMLATLLGIVGPNLVDAVLTLAVVRPGLAVEVYPLMAALLERGDLAFLAGKGLLVTVGAGILWRFRANRLSLAGASLACGCYVLVVLHHLRNLRLLAQATS